MKKLVIAEKPSVAKDIAKALDCKLNKKNDTYENDSYIISYAVGHILELYKPEDIDKKLKHWSLNTLPIIPEQFQLKPIEKTKSRVQELKKLIKSKEVDEIINACDAGREGELIFTYIYEYVKSKKTIKRLWLSSMTLDSIRNAFERLKSKEDVESLKDAAKCRSESDWLIGINGTRAISTRMFSQRSRQHATVGRVQTPTLTMVFEREKAIRSFIPRDYWKIIGKFNIKNGEYEGTYQKADFKKGQDDEDRADRIWNKEEAEKIRNALKKADKGEISETKKSSTQKPPLLYDLTTLQREANNKFGFPAGLTLSTAQSLYEKHKLITYPRTDSKFLPEDYGPTCHKVLVNIHGNQEKHAQKVIKNDWIDLDNKRIFNNKGVSDHFAIIPTETTNKVSKLTDNEFKLYNLIVSRFIAVFFPPAEFNITSRLTTIDEHQFKTEGKVLVKPGWLEVYERSGGQKETLPSLSDSDGKPPFANILDIDLSEEATKPPPRYTEATLLAAMEHAGKLVEDEDLSEAMKGKGLGTPATRAQIIDHLIREKYIDRVQRELIPTIKAENLIEFLRVLNIEELTSPDMTGEWEFRLHQIETGDLTREEFMKGIKDATSSMVEKVKSFDESKVETKETDITSPTDSKPLLENFRCYQSQDKELTIYKTMGNRKLSREEIRELLEKKKIGPLDGFRSKAGKPFSAVLKLDDDNKVKFDFGQTEEAEEIDYSQYKAICNCPKAERNLCSHNDGKIYATPNAYQCEHHLEPDTKCNFRISRTLLSRSIPEDQFLKLVKEGKTDLLDKFRSKKTKRLFSAYLILKDDCSIGFEFEAKKKKAKKETKKDAT